MSASRSAAQEERPSELTTSPWIVQRGGKAALTRARSLAWLARVRRWRDDAGVRILLYHRVSDDGDAFSVSPARFRRQMSFLAEAGYRAVDVAEVVRILDGGERASKTIGLTFDDGYRDVAENAMPVLEEHGFSATVFVATAVAAGSAPFAWFESQPAVLSWDDIERLEPAGTLVFEPHTLTHPNLVELDDAAALREIRDSKLELEQRLGRMASVFAYPAGLFGARERTFVQDAGYTAAVSTDPGVNDASTDRFALRRLQIDPLDALVDFRAKVGGGHDAPLPLQTAYRRLRYGPAARR